MIFSKNGLYTYEEVYKFQDNDKFAFEEISFNIPIVNDNREFNGLVRINTEFFRCSFTETDITYTDTENGEEFTGNYYRCLYNSFIDDLVEYNPYYLDYKELDGKEYDFDTIMIVCADKYEIETDFKMTQDEIQEIESTKTKEWFENEIERLQSIGRIIEKY